MTDEKQLPDELPDEDKLRELGGVELGPDELDDEGNEAGADITAGLK